MSGPGQDREAADAELRTEVRRRLTAALKTRTKVDAFLKDRFSDIAIQFGADMETERVFTLLLDYADPERIIDELNKWSEKLVPAAGEEDVNLRSFREGFIFAGKYRLKKLLGYGAFGCVWSAQVKDEDELVTIKILHEYLENSEKAIARFAKGVSKMKSLESHHNVIKVLSDVEVWAGCHFFVMKYVEGENFDQKMKRGQLKLDAALRIILQVGSALSYSHSKGCIHSDVKPANIIVDAKNEAYLTDFDLADSTSITGKSRNSARHGTPDFSAPEQREQPPRVDQRTDVFSLGMTLLVAINNGDSPYADPRFQEDRRRYLKRLQCKPVLRDIVTRAVELNADDRYEKMSDFYEALKKFVAGENKEKKTVTYALFACSALVGLGFTGLTLSSSRCSTAGFKTGNIGQNPAPAPKSTDLDHSKDHPAPPPDPVKTHSVPTTQIPKLVKPEKPVDPEEFLEKSKKKVSRCLRKKEAMPASMTIKAYIDKDAHFFRDALQFDPLIEKSTMECIYNIIKKPPLNILDTGIEYTWHFKD